MASDSVSFVRLIGLLAATTVFFACSNQEPKMASAIQSDYRPTALRFAQALATRDYSQAYAMTSKEYRERVSENQLQTAFESIVPLDWGAIGPIEVGLTMTAWPDKRPGDLGWAYVSIGGEVYSEAVTVVVTSENGEPKIREVEFGRP